jgi:hypothetical protein
VVDDGSPDGTGELANELALEDPDRIHVMHRSSGDARLRWMPVNVPARRVLNMPRSAKLKREIAELRRANDTLKSASAFSQRSSTAPRRNDRLHRCTSRSVRGRVHLTCPAGCNPRLSHLPRLSSSSDRPPSDRELRDFQLIGDLTDVHR